jgi:hypothetical protein
MVDSDRERLLGYLLEALEDSERESVEEELEHNPELQEHLSRFRQALRPLWTDKPDFAPPPGLADRTCRLVAADDESAKRRAYEGLEKSRPRPRVAARAMTVVTGMSGESMRFSWLDLSVATGICLVAILLVFPAVQDSRYNARRTGCQNNLRMIGQSLGQYNQFHGGYFPYVPRTGNVAFAGSYAAALKSSELLEDDRWVLCPGSPVVRGDDFSIPTLDQIMAMPQGPELSRTRKTIGGDFGYCFGYMVDGRYRGTRNLRRASFAIMADAPSGTSPDHQSLNHGGRGQNVLFEDFSVRFLPRPTWDDPVDHFFVNGEGLVAAGVHANDSVIGASSSTPFVFVGSRGVR